MIRIAATKHFSIFLIIVLLAHVHGLAQEVQWKWVARTDLSYNMTRVIDKAFSSQAYTGYSPGIGIAMDFRTDHIIYTIRASYAGGSLNSGSAPSLSMEQMYFTADLAALFRITQPGKSHWTFDAGPSLLVTYSNRGYDDFINNANTFDFSMGLGAALQLSYSFDPNDMAGITISNKLQIPVLTFIEQPAFGYAEADGYLKTSTFGSFSSFFQIANELSIAKKIGKRHQVALIYGWNYYHINTAREVIHSNQSLAASYRFFF